MSGSTFIKVSPLVLARRYAELELRGKVSVFELKWLHNNLIMWLRVLTVMQAELCLHNAKENATIQKLKPKDGFEEPSLEYMNTKVRLAKTRQARLHFLEIVERRKEEVKALIGSASLISRMTIGDIIGLLLDLDELVKSNDLVELRRHINNLIKAFTEEMLNGEM